MSLRAPLRVPVELKRSNRWFRLAREVGLDGMSLSTALPDEVEGPHSIRFHLPGSTEVTCNGEVIEEIVGEGDSEHAERRAVRFLDLDENSAARIQAYVTERLGIV
jgi:hypothetical protein